MHFGGDDRSSSSNEACVMTELIVKCSSSFYVFNTATVFYFAKSNVFYFFISIFGLDNKVSKQYYIYLFILKLLI